MFLLFVIRVCWPLLFSIPMRIASARHQEGGDSDSALLLSSKIEQMQACHALEALLEHWPSSPRATINDEGVAGVGCNNNLSSQDSVPYSTFLLPETHRLAAATLKFLKK